MAGELGLLSALQGEQPPPAAQQAQPAAPSAEASPEAQPAERAEAQQGVLALQEAEQAQQAVVLPLRVRLPSPNIVRPPPATAAAASLCTRGMGHKPLVLSSLGNASGMGPAGSSNSGEVRPTGANSGRSGNRSPPPNPFTAYAAPGSTNQGGQQGGQELRQENGSNPGPVPLGGSEGCQEARQSVSPVLRVEEQVAGLESLLALVASGTSN